MNPQKLDLLRNRIISSKGGWILGKEVHNQGYSMLEDFMGELTYMQVLIFNATGKMVDKDISDFVDNFYISMSWPDSRVWCNQIAALGGNNNVDIISSVSSAIMSSSSIYYGVKSLHIIYEFIESTYKELQSGKKIEEIINNREKFPGFTRPIVSGDQRVYNLERVRKKNSIKIGEYLKFVLLFDSKLSEHKNLNINIGAYTISVLMDLGFTKAECEAILANMVYSGALSCHIEYKKLPSGHYLPLQCNDVIYSGRSYRKLNIERTL